jgi:glycosyltransferase involved in cell wall biosynthesis
MKIAYLGIKGLPSKAGADRVVEAIVSRLDKEKHELTVYCSSQMVASGTQMPGVRLIRIPVLKGKYLHAIFLFFLSALHALFFEDFDLVHLHNAEAGVVIPILRLRFKVVATSHGLGYTLDKWSALAKFFLRLADYPFLFCANRVTSVSMPTARYYQDTYHREVIYVPNGVNINPKAEVGAARSRLNALGLSDERYIVFAAGRIIPTKGCHTLLDAWRQVNGDARLLVVGDSEQVPAYGRQLREAADERVVFVPFITSDEELFGIIQGADLFVFPSVVEAMSIMLLEAASLGVPIICSDIPANISVLAEHTLYFRSGDAQDLACKLRWAWENVGQMNQLASRARAWVEKEFSWDTVVEQYATLYDDMVADGVSRRT